MKRVVLFVICLIIAGTFAYFGGYYIYKTNRPKVSLLESENVQKAIPMSESIQTDPEDYYIGIIEQDLLVIYKMPEKTLYDTLELKSLHFYGNEEQELLQGKIFKSLTEVFEFLENSMS